MKHILLLNLVGIGIQLLWTLVSTFLYGNSFAQFVDGLYFEPRFYMEWLLLNINPYGSHLWYLSSLLVCYIALWIYVRFFEDREINYGPLYTAGFLCMTLNLIHGEFALVFGMEAPYQLTRNALLLGMPMFAFGIFLREYQERIQSSYALTTGKLVALILAGTAVSIGEWSCFGECDMKAGTLLVVFALMLLMVSHPQGGIRGKTAEKIVSRFGAYSTTVYLVHMVVKEYYMGLQQYGLYLKYGEAEAMMRPLIILGASLLIAVAWDCVVCAVKWIWNQKSILKGQAG